MDPDSSKVVDKVVTNVGNQVDISTQIMNQMKTMLVNHGISIVSAIIIFLIGFFICRWIRRVSIRLLAKNSVDPTANSFIAEIIYFFCLAIVAIIALGTAGVSTGTLAASFGAVALAVGLALKDNFSNVASGIMILLFRPINVGDYVSINGNEGYVRDIRAMYTEISTLGNQLIFIPNSVMTNSVIKNYSHYEIRNLEFLFDVGYDTDLKQCVSLLTELFREDPYVQDKTNIVVSVKEMAESSIRIYVRVQVLNKMYIQAQSELFIKVKEAFDKAGIDIPFPQLVVHQGK
jgi:small conductance mechanosensitive channel